MDVGIAETPNGAQVLNPSGDVWSHEAGNIPVISSVQLAHVESYPKRKRVVILGFASSSRHLCPFNDEDTEIWGLNQLYRHIPRADRWFDIHANYDEHVVEGTDHIGWLRACPIPVYMNEHRPEYATSIRYPIEKMIEYFGQDYFTSTIAFMLALAIYEGFEHIGLYGVDLIVGDEWEQQKPCAEFYIGWAKAAGITVDIPSESSLLTQAFRYGYQLRTKDTINLDDYIIRHTRTRARRDDLQMKLALMDGALQEDDHWYQELNTAMEEGTHDGAQFLESIKARALAVQEKRDEIKSALLRLDGAVQEDEYWMQVHKLRGRGGDVKTSE